MLKRSGTDLTRSAAEFAVSGAQRVGSDPFTARSIGIGAFAAELIPRAARWTLTGIESAHGLFVSRSDL